MAVNNNIEKSINNPWKGLNFYHEGEILYGRDDEIQSLALYVTNNTQTVLYGKSGIGKSSIINAGVFPIARKEGLFPIPIRLKHDYDTDYTSQIKVAFKESAIGISEILPALDDSHESLWEYLHRNAFYDKETGHSVRPLIVLDQFEEIFTLQHNEKKKLSFFSELADLLNEITPNNIAKSPNAQIGKKPIIPKSNDDEFSFDFGIANDSNEEKKPEYLSESLFNIVFAIREDFLSYLERYTKYIPVMKSNRYALLPINEEQAKDIIMKPIKGLVDIDVAKLIIEKITGKNDFKLDEEPEIEVDAAVLSLFLSRLYIKKDEGVPVITSALVNASSKDIIMDFYEESVGDLPENEIEKLEDLLLTYDNRRDNVSRNNLIQEGISEQTITTLVENRKLLRQFSYQGDIRIEFIHDILCPIVNERIERREEARLREREQYLQKQKMEEEEKKNRLLKKKNRILRMFVIVLGLAAIISGVFILKSVVGNNTNVEDDNIVSINLVEDEFVKSERFFWRANLLVTGVTLNGVDTILLQKEIDDKYIDSTLQFNINLIKKIDVSLIYGRSSFVDTKNTYKYSELEKNPIITLLIQKRLPKTIEYSGRIYTSINKFNIPVQNAIVVVHDIVAHTDDNGVFKVILSDSIRAEDMVYIVKEGFTTVEMKAKDLMEDNHFKPSLLLDFDSSYLYDFERRCVIIDSLILNHGEKWDYWRNNFVNNIGFTINTSDSTKDILVIAARSIQGTKNGRMPLEGVYYFKSEYDKCLKNGHPHYSYHLFKGSMDKTKLKRGGKERKNFDIESFDVVNNRQTVSDGEYDINYQIRCELKGSSGAIVGTVGY